MATIRDLSLRNFKSFRAAHVPLGKGFVTIIGPNGSGKSNLTDALRFAFGENHLRALRARKIQDLIYQGSDKAYIRLNIDGIGTNGDSQAEIIRAIRSDGKTLYRLNGRRTTRTVVVDFLKANGLDVGEHNVIAQGEVEKIARLNSKERREIIDKVAGISEFEEKRSEALAELGKVEQKLNDASIVMKEREGVLAELEKEKDAALKYASLKEEQRRVKGTLVITQYKKTENEFTGLVNKCVEAKKRIADAGQETEKLVANAGELDRKRNEINAKIAAMDTRNVYAELAQLRSKIEIDENVLREKTTALNRLQSEANGLSAEEEKIEAKLSEFGGAKRSSAARAAELKARLEQLSAQRDKSAKEWEERRKKLGVFDKLLDDRRKEAEKLREEITRLKTQLEMSSPAGGMDGRKSLEAELKEIDAEIGGMKSARTRLFEREKELNQCIQRLDSEILKLSEELAANRGSARSVIPQAISFIDSLRGKGEVSGVFGTVGELFKIDKKYEIAAETAAGQRLNYIVVSDLAKATEMVKLLKERSMGRATFIPLGVRVPPRGEAKNGKEQKGKGILGKVIDIIEFDRQFDNVFQYVFGDTLLVENVDVFKSVGTRAVTLEGDLYETSGIVTGGAAIKRSLRERANLPKLERELDGKKKEREHAIAELYSINEEITTSRRAVAEKEVRRKEIEIELGATGATVKVDDARAELLGKEADLQDIEREMLNTQGEKERIRVAIENSEDEKERARFDDEITAIRTELSALEAKLKGEEGIILQERLNVVKTTKGQLTAEMKAIGEETKEIEKRLKQNRKSLDAKEEKIKDESKMLEKLYAEVKQIQAQLDAINVERGRIERRVERTKEDLIRSETLKEEIEKRLADLKYEADFYREVTIIEAKREELEQRAVQVEAELQSIGTVNMKAPEMYEEKAKDYNMVKEKVAVLGGERASVLKMIEEVEFRKKDVFMKAFREINEHFRRLAGSIFQNEVTLRLENEANPFDGGLRIVMTIGKRERNVELMSGGEKSLLTIMFVFALHMCRPSQFYILDEVEAALDKENSKKFSELIKQISQTTQFIVVSHNDTVITSADTALGVAKTKQGSRIVSIKLT